MQQIPLKTHLHSSSSRLCHRVANIKVSTVSTGWTQTPCDKDPDLNKASEIWHHPVMYSQACWSLSYHQSFKVVVVEEKKIRGRKQVAVCWENVLKPFFLGEHIPAPNSENCVISRKRNLHNLFLRQIFKDTHRDLRLSFGLISPWKHGRKMWQPSFDNFSTCWNSRWWFLPKTFAGLSFDNQFLLGERDTNFGATGHYKLCSSVLRNCQFCHTDSAACHRFKGS